MNNAHETQKTKKADLISFPAPEIRSDRGKAPELARDLMQETHGASRMCRHVLTGRFNGPRLCTRNYQCYHCGFDQMLDDMELAGVG